MGKGTRKGRAQVALTQLCLYLASMGMHYHIANHTVVVCWT